MMKSYDHELFVKAHPTPEHFLPMVVAVGCATALGLGAAERIHDSWAFGDLSMSCYSFQ
jgi:aromatic ring-opening dioxygenase catalytic subunit (LigB family)